MSDDDLPISGISPTKERAIVAMLQESSMSKAADIIEVNVSTLYRWLREDPVFAEAYKAARREAFGQAISLTQRFAGTAVATLVRIMSDPTSPQTARVNAAIAVLRFAREGIEIDDLSDRIHRLEENFG